MLYEWTKYYNLVLIIGFWMKNVDCFEFFCWVCSTELFNFSRYLLSSER
jgi:hypothetical protein